MKTLENNGRRGFYLIGLLIVLAIIVILSYSQLAPDQKANQVNLATTSIDKSKVSACAGNRLILSQNLTMWRINHPGETPSIEAMRQSGMSVPGCPGGGVYSIRPDTGAVYCDKHFPDPATLPPPEPAEALNPDAEDAPPGEPADTPIPDPTPASEEAVE